MYSMQKKNNILKLEPDFRKISKSQCSVFSSSENYQPFHIFYKDAGTNLKLLFTHYKCYRYEPLSTFKLSKETGLFKHMYLQEGLISLFITLNVITCTPLWLNIVYFLNYIHILICNINRPTYICECVTDLLKQ